MSDVLLNKAASIQRAIQRAREEFSQAGSDFANNYSRQDAAILNIIRACETALDLANHIIRKEKLGLANSSRESFNLLAQAGRIPADLGKQLEKMISFRNIAVHEYTKLNIEIVESIIQKNLDDLMKFSKIMVTA